MENELTHTGPEKAPMREFLSLLSTFKDYSLTPAIYDLRAVKPGPNPFGSEWWARTKAIHLRPTYLISRPDQFAPLCLLCPV